MIQFYKPNPRNSGSACSFYKTRDGAIMFSMIKQSSWDDSKKTGSFQKNKTDPKGNVKVKLSATEAAGFLDTIDKDVEFKEFHNSQNQTIQIRFAPYIDKNTNERKGFSLSVYKQAKDSQDKLSFLIGLNFREARLVKEYLIYLIQNSFVNSQKEKTEQNEIETEEEVTEAPKQPVKQNQEQTAKNDDLDW